MADRLRLYTSIYSGQLLSELGLAKNSLINTESGSGGLVNAIKFSSGESSARPSAEKIIGMVKV